MLVGCTSAVQGASKGVFSEKNPLASSLPFQFQRMDPELAASLLPSLPPAAVKKVAESFNAPRDLDDVLRNDLNMVYEASAGNDGNGLKRKYYIGNAHSVRKDVFDALNIGAHINCAPTVETPAKVDGVPFLRLSMADGPHPGLNVQPIFENAIGFVQKNNEGNVMIQCFGGQNRSCTICAAILMKLHRIPDPVPLIASRREICKIGPVYQIALKKYKETLG